jgi:flagellar assembly protein FliH
MSNAVKFMFETPFEDLDLETFDAAARARLPRYSEAELENARAEALAQGTTMGLERARAEAERAIAKSLDEIDQGLKALQATDQVRRKEAARLALAIGRKLAAALLEREPLAEIEALVRECLSEVADEPRVVIRVDEALLEHLKARLETVKAESGFGGEVIVLGDDAIAGSDCRVEWADGGAERSLAVVEGEVAAVIERFLRECDAGAAEASAPPPAPAPDTTMPGAAPGRPDGVGAAGPSVDPISTQPAGDEHG